MSFPVSSRCVVSLWSLVSGCYKNDIVPISKDQLNLTGLFLQSHPFSELIFFARKLPKTFCTYNCGQDAILNINLVIYVPASLRHRRNLALFKSVYKTAPKSLFCAPTVYQDLNTRHDWPVKKDNVNLSITNKGNSKRTFGNLLSPLGAYNDNISRRCFADVTNRC